MSSLPILKVDLNPPPLRELVDCIQNELAQNFQSASVSVEQCPDLRQTPYSLAFSGLCGSPRIADVGGQPNLAPAPDFSKKYDLLEISKLMEMPEEQGALLGAAAGPFHVVGMNSELMPNLAWDSGKVVNETHFARVKDDGGALCEKLSSHDCALMANLFGSAGLPGEVLHVTASSRKGSLNFTEAIRKALKERYGTRIISIGGVFIISKGKAKLHVMPDFPPNPLVTDEQKQEWLKFYNMKAPLVCLSVLHSFDPGLDLRIEHTHCFSDHAREVTTTRISPQRRCSMRRGSMPQRSCIVLIDREEILERQSEVYRLLQVVQKSAEVPSTSIELIARVMDRHFTFLPPGPCTPVPRLHTWACLLLVLTFTYKHQLNYFTFDVPNSSYHPNMVRLQGMFAYADPDSRA